MEGRKGYLTSLFTRDMFEGEVVDGKDERTFAKAHHCWHRCRLSSAVSHLSSLCISQSCWR